MNSRTKVLDVKPLEILSAGALEGLLNALIPDFTRESGHAIDLKVGTIGVVQQKLKAGQQADLVIMSPAAIAAMEQDGAVLKASAANICQAEAGVGVAVGAPRPDISTPETFRQALLAARTITATDPKAGGTAGVHFAALLQRMRIADDVRSKLMMWDTGRAVIETIATRKADLGVTFISELMLDPRVSVVGPLPPGMRLTNVYTAAIPTRSAAVGAARAFIGFLTKPATQARFKPLGLTPA